VRAPSTEPRALGESRTPDVSPAAVADVDCEPEMFPSEPPAEGPVGFEAADGRFGFKDGQGRVVIPAQFQFAYAFFEQGLGAAVLANQFVFINRNGQLLAQAFPYDNGPDYFVEGRARIVRDGKVGFIDKSGAIVVEPRFDFAGAFCQGRAPVCVGCRRVVDGEHDYYEGGRWGQIDLGGRLLGELSKPGPK
jgi:WG containing repeat